MKITQSELRELLFYSPIVGTFEWRKVGPGRRNGLLAGSVDTSGYIRIRVKGKTYPAQRLAWLYMTGETPEGVIDHIDGDKKNNAFSNLRKATPGENSQNMRLSKSSSSGVKGVFFFEKRYWAAIRKGNRYLYRKSFLSIHEAEAAIKAERERLHGEFANHGVHGYEQEELDSE